jgi:hypothetical protein
VKRSRAWIASFVVSDRNNELYFREKSLKFPEFLREFFMAQFRFRTPSGIAFYPTHYISHALIVISVIVAALGFLFPFLK